MIHCPKCSHMCSYKKEVEGCEHRRGKNTQEYHVSMEAGLGETNVSHRSWQPPRSWKRKPILPGACWGSTALLTLRFQVMMPNLNILHPALWENVFLLFSIKLWSSITAVSMTSTVLLIVHRLVGLTPNYPWCRRRKSLDVCPTSMEYPYMWHLRDIGGCRVFTRVA